MDNKAEIIACLKEMREACAALMRVCAIAGVIDDAIEESHRSGVRDGFGVRCKELIERLEREP